MKNSELINQLDSAFDMRNAGDYAGALGQFESLERQSVHPQDIAALRFFQATCLTDMGRPDDALKRISRVDKSNLIFAKQVDYEYERARIERTLGRPREALGLVEKALKMVDGTSDKEGVSVVSGGLRTLHGILLAESGKCDEAIPMLEAVSIEDQGWAEARLLLGDCSYKSRRYRKAIDYYLSLMSAANQVESVILNDALRNIGCAYHQLGDYAKAAEYLSKIKDAYDEYPSLKAQLLGFLASAYSHLGIGTESVQWRADLHERL